MLPVPQVPAVIRSGQSFGSDHDWWRLGAEMIAAGAGAPSEKSAPVMAEYLETMAQLAALHERHLDLDWAYKAWRKRSVADDPQLPLPLQPFLLRAGPIGRPELQHLRQITAVERLAAMLEGRALELRAKLGMPAPMRRRQPLP